MKFGQPSKVAIICFLFKLFVAGILSLTKPNPIFKLFLMYFEKLFLIYILKIDENRCLKYIFKVVFGYFLDI